MKEALQDRTSAKDNTIVSFWDLMITKWGFDKNREDSFNPSTFNDLLLPERSNDKMARIRDKRYNDEDYAKIYKRMLDLNLSGADMHSFLLFNSITTKLDNTTAIAQHLQEQIFEWKDDNSIGILENDLTNINLNTFNEKFSMIYKCIFKFIRQLSSEEYKKFNFPPLFLAEFDLTNSLGHNKFGIGMHYYQVQEGGDGKNQTIRMICNVNGFEKYIDKTLIDKWKEYEKNKDDNTEKNLSGEINNLYKLYTMCEEELKDAKKKQNELDCSAWINSIEKIKKKIGQPPKKEGAKWLRGEKNKWFSAPNNLDVIGDYYLSFKDKYDVKSLFQTLNLYTSSEIEKLKNSSNDNWFNKWKEIAIKNRNKSPKTLIKYKLVKDINNDDVESLQDCNNAKWMNATADDNDTETHPEYISIYERASETFLKNKFENHMNYVEKFKQKKATYNNDESSRSHIIFELLITQEGHLTAGGSNIGNKLIICDLAGKEDVIDSEKMVKYIQNIHEKKADETQHKWKFLNELNKLYENKFKQEEEVNSNANINQYKLFNVTGNSIDVYLNENHKYILDLLSEGRMINSTLENLKSLIVNKDNESGSGNSFITDYWKFYEKNSFNTIPSNYNKEDGVNINLEGNISSKYEDLQSIKEREYKQLKIPYKSGSEWFKVEDKLSNEIKTTKVNGNTTNYILFTINLNERSTLQEIENEDKVNNTPARFKAESTLASLSFIKQLAFLENNIIRPKKIDNNYFPEDKWHPLKNTKFNYADDYVNICQKLKNNVSNVLYRSPYYDLLGGKEEERKVLLSYNKQQISNTSWGAGSNCPKYPTCEVQETNCDEMTKNNRFMMNYKISKCSGDELKISEADRRKAKTQFLQYDNEKTTQNNKTLSNQMAAHDRLKKKIQQRKEENIGGGKRRNKSLKRMKLKRNISLKGGRKRQLKKNIRKTLKKKKRVSSFKLKNLKIQSKARRNRNTLKKRK